MKIDKIKAKKVFEDYVDNYDSSNSKIKLKVTHTFKVSNICEEIARGLKLSEDDIDLAYLIWLLHDIARFEQAKRYGTFNDAKSINHAKLGVDILFNQGMIRDFIEDDSEDDVIKDSILYHNAFELPNDLSDRKACFAKLIRDADKIDIFRVNVSESPVDMFGVCEEELYNSVVTKEVMDSFKRRETVLRSLKKTPVDNVASHIALVFGLYYDESIKIAVRQGNIEKLVKFKPKNEVAIKQFDELRDEYYSYIKEII